MKLYDGTSQSNVLESNLAGGVSSFNIARTPHMFNILSSGLYKDKIAAVLREIGFNAADAHIMAGHPKKPFEVKLPTLLDRTFYIKDWGPGLDDQEVRNLYTVYGLSTKQNDDSVTGAFGLGSKSPYAYTLQHRDKTSGFTVTAVKHGVQRTYSCYLDDEGVPSIALLHECEASPDWKSGVQVGFSVQKGDIEEFKQTAASVFQWFSVKPKVLGLPANALETPSGKIDTEQFSICNTGLGNYSTAVLMGNVLYPVELDIDALVSREPPKTASSLRLLLRECDLLLKAPIGSVLMTPSRESLQDVERTRSFILNAAREALAEVRNQVKEVAKKFEGNRFGLIKYVETWRRNESQWYAFVQLLDSVFKECGINVAHSNRVCLVDMPELEEEELEAKVHLDLYRESPTRALVKRYWPHDPEVELTTRTVVFINDAKHAVTRVRKHVQESREEVLLVSASTSWKASAEPDAKAQLQAIEDYANALVETGDLEGAPLRRVSELEEVVVHRTEKTPGAPAAAKKARTGPRVRQYLGSQLASVREFQPNGKVQMVVWYPTSKGSVWLDAKTESDKPHSAYEYDSSKLISQVHEWFSHLVPEGEIFFTSTLRDFQEACSMGAQPVMPWLERTVKTFIAEHPLGNGYNVLRDVFPLLSSCHKLGLGERVLQEQPQSIAAWWFQNVEPSDKSFFDAVTYLAEFFKWNKNWEEWTYWSTHDETRDLVAKKFPLSQVMLEMPHGMEDHAKELAWTALEKSRLFAPMSETFLKELAKTRRK